MKRSIYYAISKKFNKDIIKIEPKIKKLFRHIQTNQGQDLLFVLDWDMTCTVHRHNGLPMAINALIRNSPRISKFISEQSYSNFQKYYPFLFTQEIGQDEKFAMAREWWNLEMALLAENLDQSTFQSIVLDDEMVMRNYFLEFIRYTHRKKIPVIIFSAGIGNFIETYLKFKKIERDNIYIVSNWLNFTDKNYSSPIIHSLNKHQVDLTKQPFWDKISDKTDVIVIGDHIDDHQMAISISDWCRQIKIGFLNNDNCSIYREKYLQEFDVVLHTNADFGLPYEILKSI